MPGAHHIHRQRLILEAPGLKTEDQWHDRLRRFHELRLLPLLEAACNAADEGRTRYIERLEISLTLDDPEQLEREAPRQVVAALAKALRANDNPGDRANSPAFAQLLHFLSTGNLPWAAGSVTDLRTIVTEWLPSATEMEWRVLFTAWSRQPKVFLGRATQVQGELVYRAWSVLLSGVPLPEIDAAGKTGPSEDPGVWGRLLRAGWSPETGVVSAKPSTPSADSHRDRTETKGDSGGQTSHEAWFPQNSGIVLLHPYLNYLLEQVDCTDTARAATLFHYLVWGNRNCGEWDLPLTKLLLGQNPDAYLVPEDYLSQADRAAADDLLEGVIGHWSALKNTSIHALRDGFLQRPGRLTEESPGWRLTVEEHPHDLLLDRIPWSIGLIRSKRMAITLHVTWR